MERDAGERRWEGKTPEGHFSVAPPRWLQRDSNASKEIHGPPPLPFDSTEEPGALRAASFVPVEEGSVRIVSAGRQSFSRAIQAWRGRRRSLSPHGPQRLEGTVEVLPPRQLGYRADCC